MAACQTLEKWTNSKACEGENLYIQVLCKREPFFHALEEEVVKAELSGRSVIVKTDFNSQLGPDFISNDPHEQSENGK